MQKFCHNCGKETQAGWKSCPWCNTALGSLSSTPTNSVSRRDDYNPVLVSRGEDEDDTITVDRIFQLRQNKLHVDIVKDRVMTETIGNTILASQGSPKDDFKRDATKIDNKTILAELAKEAGTLRQ